MRLPLVSLILVAGCGTLLSAGQGSDDYRRDFAQAWQAIDESYAYFDQKATVWPDIPRLYDADLARVGTREQFVELLEHVIDELYDPHAQLTTNLASSPRLVPSGTDLWTEWNGAEAVVTQVRSGSDAAGAGIRADDRILSINGLPIAEAVDARMGRSYPRDVGMARDWALRAVIAGRHNRPRRLSIRRAGVVTAIDLPAADQFTTAAPTPLDWREMQPGIGYIQINDSLGDTALIDAFDRAVEGLRHTRGMIVDLRNTPSGGNTSIARAILGRFVRQELPYQKHVLPGEERATSVRRSWLELVSPRAAMYSGRVAVLVGRWTGSMGEGLAIGFDATKAAVVIGTRMAGLVGATTRITLIHTGIGINVPTERLYHVNGLPRESFQPVEPAGAPDDAVLMGAAVRAIEQ